ncbi:unnamed protein product [Orchesella dallaii]|uniref:Odorant receptor n=1 Tax=Orchesella dallaii TaxID=48710 RepID=A0ABP1RSV0_9HEXA
MTSWKENLGTVSFYCIIGDITILLIVTVLTMEDHGYEICWLLTQQMTPLGIKKRDFSSSSSMLSFTLKELFIYSMCLVFFWWPVLTLILPFIIDFCPLNLILGSLPYSQTFPPLLRKIIEGIWYSSVIYMGATIVLVYVTGVLATVEMNQTLLYHITPSNPQETNFRKYFRRFHIIQIEIHQHNVVDKNYVPTLVAVGISFSVSGFYIALVCYGLLPLLLYYCLLAMAVMITLYISVIVPLASKPHERYLHFISFWKHVLLRKAERKELESCFPLAYEIRPFLKVQKRTMLDILGCILNNTMIFVLLK